MDNSPLGTLPAELRNNIYSLVLHFQDPFVFAYKMHGNRTRFAKISKQRLPLALTATCKEVREHTTKLFYATNTFTFLDTDDNDATYIFDWFTAVIGRPSTAALRSLVFDSVDLEGHQRFRRRRTFTDGIDKMLMASVRRRAIEAPHCRFTLKAATEIKDYDASFRSTKDRRRIKVPLEVTFKGMESDWSAAIGELLKAAEGARTERLRLEVIQYERQLAKFKDGRGCHSAAATAADAAARANATFRRLKAKTPLANNDGKQDGGKEGKEGEEDNDDGKQDGGKEGKEGEEDSEGENQAARAADAAAATAADAAARANATFRRLKAKTPLANDDGKQDGGKEGKEGEEDNDDGKQDGGKEGKEGEEDSEGENHMDGVEKH